MAIRRDYIVRQFEAFGKFLALVLNYKKDGKWSELENLINESSLEFTSLHINDTEQLKDFELISDLENRKLNEAQIKMLGDLLYEKGLAYTELFEYEKGRNAFQKALLIYQYINENSLETDFSLDVHFKIKALRQLLAG